MAKQVWAAENALEDAQIELRLLRRVLELLTGSEPLPDDLISAVARYSRDQTQQWELRRVVEAHYTWLAVLLQEKKP